MYDKLKKEMSKKGITGYRLAQLTGMNANTIYTALKWGRMFPAWRKRIADALGEPEEELFTPEERGLK